MKKQMFKKVPRIRWFWIILLALISLFLIAKAVVPSGHIIYKTDFKPESSFIKKLSPQDRLIGHNVVIGDPVYFSLYTPRAFDSAKLTISYRPDNVSLVEAGVLAENLVGNYKLEPIYNDILEKLARSWDVITTDGQMLLQRTRDYDSLESFFEAPPAIDELLLYNYQFQPQFDIAGYTPSPDNFKLPFFLRGAYRFLVYLENEDLDVTFEFKDLNRNNQADDIYIDVYAKQELVFSEKLADGKRLENEELENRADYNLLLSGLPAGVYGIEVRTNDDVLSSFVTGQEKLVFENKLPLWFEQNQPLNIWTDVNALYVRTTIPQALQSIGYDGQELVIDESYKQYKFKLEPGPKNIVLERDGVVLEGRGLFALSQASFFNPYYKALDTDADLTGINYILADYNLPRLEGDNLISTVEFDIHNVYREKRQYNFIISIPGLKAEDEIDDKLLVNSIVVELEGKSLFKKIGEILFHNYE